MPPKQQPYVPGLNTRPDDLEVPSQPPDTETEMSKMLIDDFLMERKNPTMCLHEYCAQKKLTVQYKEEAVESSPGILSSFGGFAFRAVIEGLAYPQGVASTKKEARNEASRKAFRAVLRLDAYEPQAVEPELDDFRFAEVRTLSDLCEQNKLEYKKMMTKDTKGNHICTVTVTGLDPFVASSSMRNEAVVKAHAAAIFAVEDTFPVGLPSIAASRQPAADLTAVSTRRGSRIPDAKMALLREEAAFEALNTYLESLPVEFRSCDHHVAAIFAVHKHWPGFEGPGKIVAFGTGNSTIAVESLTLDGRCVIDSTCLVTARRAFKRYLAQEIIYCFSTRSSIFERWLLDPTRLRLKDGLSFHLYLSHPPDGDYKESLAVKSVYTDQQLTDIAAGAHYPTFSDEMHGQLRCKNEQAMIELTSQTPLQTSLAAVRLANEMQVMSTSDKLLRWNILGLQGAALTHIIDPIYLKSVSLGYHADNDHGHLCRAICCRVYSDLQDQLPEPYIINHPALAFVLKSKRNSNQDLAIGQESINMNAHDTKVELVDGLTGRSHSLSPFQVSKQMVSRQCKAGQHLKWFKDICSTDGGYRMKMYTSKSPMEVKAMAVTYQSAKKEFMNHCMECNIGKWLHAPPELSMFSQ